VESHPMTAPTPTPRTTREVREAVVRVTLLPGEDPDAADLRWIEKGGRPAGYNLLADLADLLIRREANAYRMGVDIAVRYVAESRDVMLTCRGAWLPGEPSYERLDAAAEVLGLELDKLRALAAAQKGG
jgi:hypothetical protein